MIEHAQLIFWLVVLLGFYMSWNIGANDVANAMGTSVGSRAISFKQAILIASVFEFAGAVFVGSSVTNTIKKGIVDIEVFSATPEVLVIGMLASLLAASVWLQMATTIGWPVSTTHSIIGAVVGFGLIAGGSDIIHWDTMGQVAMSWVISPLSGALISLLIYSYIRRNILNSATPVIDAKRHTPRLVLLLFTILCLSLFYKGLKNLHLDFGFVQAFAMALAVGLLAMLISHRLLQRIPSTAINRTGLGAKFSVVEKIFGYLQVLTACYIAFAHGANDVANAIGPLAAVIMVLKTGSISTQVAVPIWVLVLGGAGIVTGIATFGYRIIQTIGTKITKITPSKGFAATFGAATTVLICSKLGMPISTTHTLVGSVIGVGVAGGMGAVNLSTLRGIVSSWFITIPASGLMCCIFFELMSWMLL